MGERVLYFLIFLDKLGDYSYMVHNLYLFKTPSASFLLISLQIMSVGCQFNAITFRLTNRTTAHVTRSLLRFFFLMLLVCGGAYKLISAIGSRNNQVWVFGKLVSLQNQTSLMVECAVTGSHSLMFNYALFRKAFIIMHQCNY